MTKEERPVFLQPKILLIDLDPEIEFKLKHLGYSVQGGSFGQPVIIPPEFASIIRFHSIRPKFNLPYNYTEQDIYVADLKRQPTSFDSNFQLFDHDNVRCYTEHIDGVCDFSPIIMSGAGVEFGQVIQKGGIFIVFAEPKKNFEYRFAPKSPSRINAWKGRQIEFHSNWSFMGPFADELQVVPIRGEDVRVTDGNDPLRALLREYSKEIRYTCSFSLSPLALKIGVLDPLLTNRFGQYLAATYRHPDLKYGLVILPQLSNKGGFLEKMITTVMPALEEGLFPMQSCRSWLNDKTYATLKQQELIDQIDRIKQSSLSEIEKLQKELEIDRENSECLQNILVEKDDRLVLSLKMVLERFVGFHSVVDIDSEIVKLADNQTKQEDLRVIEPGKSLLLLEVKGRDTGSGKDDFAMQCEKWVRRAKSRESRDDIRGVVILNHQRNLLPIKRNENPFSRDQIEDAINLDMTLFTTWDLFILVREMHRHKWPQNAVKSLFFKAGRHDTVPNNYRMLGTVTNVWRQQEAFACSIGIDLKVSDVIAFWDGLRFWEGSVLTIQKKGESIVCASSGEIVGIKWSTSKLPPKDVRLFLRDDSIS